MITSLILNNLWLIKSRISKRGQTATGFEDIIVIAISLGVGLLVIYLVIKNVIKTK